MKRLMMIINLVAIVSFCQAQGLNFSKPANWQALLEQAKKEDKYLFVDCYATWCGPCKLMDQQTFTNEGVGKAMNDKYISVKLQTDQSAQDDDYIKSWYADAQNIAKTYQVNILPTQLFFSPDGELLYRDAGYKSPGALVRAATFAADPKLKNISREIEKFKKGKPDYEQMPTVIIAVMNTIGDPQLLKRMTADYNANYLNHMKDTAKVLTHDNVFIAYELQDTMKSSDNIIRMLMVKKAEDIDKLDPEWHGMKERILSGLARYEDLDSKLWKGKTPTMQNPDWDKLQKTIAQKYKFDAGPLIYDYRFNFYNKTQNLPMMNKYNEMEMERMKKERDYFGINMICWHKYFRPVTDKRSLELALRWMDTCLTLEQTAPLEYGSVQEYDTKAGLLYKLGRRKEAIIAEQKALELRQADNIRNNRDRNKDCDELVAIIEQMKRGEKTHMDEKPVYPADWKLLD